MLKLFFPSSLVDFSTKTLGGLFCVSLVATTNLHPSFSHCYRAFFSHKIVSKHMGMAKSIFFLNSKTHWKIIFFKNFKITKHVTTQDHRVQLNYLRFKNQKIPGHKYISPLWKNSDNSFDKNLKISKLVTTQENRAQYLKIKNLKIHGHKNISSFWRKPDKSLDKFSFGGFRIFKKLKPPLRSAENIASSPLDLTTYSHELISTSPLTTTLTPPPPSNWMNYLGDPADSTHSDNLILRPNELSTVTQFVTPDLTPTVTPSGSLTCGESTKLPVRVVHLIVTV